MSFAALRLEYDLLRDWLFVDALPLWAGTGTDRETGGFFEKLTEKGVPLDDPRRARVTARQIFSFATADRLGWQGDGAGMVEYGLANLFRHHLPPQGIVVPTVSADGQVLRRDFDLYDHAFVLFGLAAATEMRGGDAALAARAADLRDAMVAGWSHPQAGFEESQPRSLPLKANPHMHIFEAALAWEELSDDPGWAALSDNIAELCLERFLDPNTGALKEYFDGEWNALPMPQDVVEPGHQFEWAWLLRRWGASRRRPDALSAAARLAEIGEGRGVDPAQDLAVNELNADLTLRDGLFRLWPQTERLKAHVSTFATATDSAIKAQAAEFAARSAKGLRRYFEHPVPGSWWEHLGLDGRPHDMTEPTRASSLYHITCAIGELGRHLDALHAIESVDA
ncbi:AGE family epimerase/isomerase [Paracoccus ravus]|uniref:AGE family epimerase/isomerase n=1 Tax=Paracoccus ravus TaxID=2447760 RepID=UPI00106EDBAA|nr:AGE family epimerase/isomerase [Paracoccus ravus]